jgi:predicted nucleic acid-binding protein
VIPAIAITSTVLDFARTMSPAALRCLDAIHVATAQLAGDKLAHLITYDKRMITAATAAGLRTASP